MEAFELLYKRFSTAIFNYLLKLVGNWALAEDLLEETFIKLYKSNLDQRGKLENWLLRVATNLSYRAIRKRNYENTDCDEETFRYEQNLEQKIGNRITIQKTLLKIPETQRVVIILKFYHGMKYKEIAEILGCPLGTVKTRMHNGLKKMHEFLAKN